MHKRIFTTAMAAGTLLLATPIATFAATSDTVTTEDIENALVDEGVESAPISADGKGGGGMSSIYYPNPGGGVVVDVSVTKEVTPDYVAINAYCDLGRNSSRDDIRTSLQKVYEEIKAGVGKDGKVRRTGGFSIYPYYDSTGKETSSFSGNISILIRITNMKATQRISDLVESKNCSANWDVRLLDTQSYELDVLDTLVERANKRKKVFEKLLGKKLTKVVNASLYTWVDGYTTYDPETNKADATTTLSLTFDIGSRGATLPATPATRVAPPKG